jgi:hypothetical protein
VRGRSKIPVSELLWGSSAETTHRDCRLLSWVLKACITISLARKGFWKLVCEEVGTDFTKQLFIQIFTCKTLFSVSGCIGILR